MASVIDEIVAIEQIVKSAFPSARTEKQTVPEKPETDTFVIRYLNGDPAVTETRYHYRMEREYQIVYFSQWPEDAFPKMDALTAAFMADERIPATGSRIEGFAYSQPMLTENGIYVTIGVLQTITRESRAQPVYDKIRKVNTRYM